MEAATRVVHEHVDRSEEPHGVVDVAVHRGVVAHVEQSGDGRAAERFDLGGGRGEAVGVAVADRDVGAEARQRDRDARGRCPGPRR